MHKRIHILLFFLPLLAFVLHLPSLDAGEWSDVLRKARLGEQKVEFYGLVLDQFEKPVEGAKVLFEYSAYGFPMPINRKGRTLTGADGRFEIHGGKAAILYITDIVLRGCEFSLKSNINTSFDYDRSYVKRHRPDKKNPVVFHLRRKHTEAVVLLSCESRIRINGGAGEEWLGLDLSSGDTVEPRFKGNQQYFHDLEFTWEHDEEKKEWALTIKMNGENAGVLMSDKLLYEAPSDGYAKEVALTFKYSDEPPLKHLYLRLRDCGMYARLDIDHGRISEKGVFFFCRTVINPYGSRSLEDLVYVGSDESGELILKCFKEARKAMKEQRFALRPPFEQWIREGKAKY